MSLTQRRSREAGQGVPAPASDTIDALVEAVSAGARPSPSGTTEESDRVARSVVTLPPGTRRSWISSRVARWMAPAILAFAIGLGGAVWGLRTFESFEPQTDTVDVSPAPEAPAAPATPTPALPSPAHVDHLASIDLRPSAPFARTYRPLLTATDRLAARTAFTNADTLVITLAPGSQIDRRAAGRVPPRANANARAVRPAATPAQTEADATSVDAATPVASTPAPLTSTSPVSPTTESIPALAESTATSTDMEAAEETAVLDAVEEYAQALEQFDVNAAAALWPSVDRRALSRAFASLKSQNVMFDDCDVAFAAATATARCHGTAHYVAKVGPSSPRTGRYEWLFKMRKRDDAWKIEGLSAWPMASAGRDQQ